MKQWTNWSGRLRASPGRIVEVADEQDIVDALRLASDEGARVRCVGAAHSHSKLVVTAGTCTNRQLSASAATGVRSRWCCQYFILVPEP